MATEILKLIDLEKHYDGSEVLRSVNLTVYKGEFLSLLGPSGCGKTTILKVISGLTEADKGKVLIEGQDMTNVPPNKRNVNTVFQSYALFPHMNVAENVGYGLKIRKFAKDDIQTKVSNMLDKVGLSGFEKRSIDTLSGGQKQRVALARALILSPKIILLDEPLSALDVHLRRKMQIELKNIQKNLGVTFIYITHDQEEAINMSDRIVVMENGKFHQVGTPNEIYNSPKTTFVASFVNNANVISGAIIDYAKDSKGNNITKIKIGNSSLNITTSDLPINSKVCLSCLKENIRIGEENIDGNSIPATVSDKSFVGGLLKIDFQLEDGQSVISRRYGINYNIEVGEETTIGWDYKKTTIVGAEGECYEKF